MPKDLSNYRKSYEKQELLESNCPKNPLDLFQKWFLHADNSDSLEIINKSLKAKRLSAHHIGEASW